MCLSCNHKIGAHGKEAIKKLFSFPKWAWNITDAGHGVTGNFLHTYDNKSINLTYAQVNEIVNNASVVIATGVDTRIDIWAIQWPNDYKVTTLNTV